MSLSDYNIYDFVSFPDREVRRKAKAVFFDVTKLRLNMGTYLQNNSQQQKSYDWELPFIIENILAAENERRNSFEEVMRRINNQISVVDITLMTVFGYHEKMLVYAEHKEYDKYVIVEMLFRYECVRACFEYYSIKEKYKTVLRQLYRVPISPKTTESKFFEKLKTVTSGNTYVERFIVACVALSNSPNYKFVMGIRNDEVHNIPLIDDSTFVHYSPEHGLQVGGPDYIKDSGVLFSTIKAAYDELVPVKDSLQRIIDNHIAY